MIEIKNISGLLSHFERLKERQMFCEGNYGTERWSAKADYPMLYSLVKIYEPAYVFECGTNSGLSAMAFSLGFLELGKGRVFTWDVKQYDPADKNTNLQRFIEPAQGPFHENVGSVIIKYGKHRKLIFIDGNHNRDWAIKDFNSVKPYLKKDDIVVFHDAKASKGVKLALEKIRRTFQPSREFELNSKCGMKVYVI